jgi:predicted ribosomally synthesized peptide with nif11-like leader
MSKQAVMNFIVTANQDKALYEKVNSLPSNRVEALMDIAHDAGFDFTADEFIATVLDVSELKEEDLEQIAGGASDYLRPGSQVSLNFTMPTDQLSLNFVKFAGK